MEGVRLITFYFHDVLQTRYLSKLQEKELDKHKHLDLLKQTLEPFEHRNDIRVVLLVLAEGIELCRDEVEYIKQHPEWEIGCHGLYHEDFSKKTVDAAELDLFLAKGKLEIIFGKKVEIFLPPWKRYNEGTEQVCKKLGLTIELDEFFSIKHMNSGNISEHKRFDVHYMWPIDRRKVNSFFEIMNLKKEQMEKYSGSCDFVGVNVKHGKETPEFWDKIWKNHKAGERKHAKLYVELKKYLKGKILDLACGITPLYSDGEYDVVGVDLSPDAMALMKERCPSGTFIVEDIRDVAFPDETFDTILLSSAIEHFENFDSLLINSKEFLKSGGTIVIVVPENHHFRTHVHCEWDEEKIQNEIGNILEDITYYQIQLPHGKEWIIVYKKGEKK